MQDNLIPRISKKEYLFFTEVIDKKFIEISKDQNHNIFLYDNDSGITDISYMSFLFGGIPSDSKQYSLEALKTHYLEILIDEEDELLKKRRSIGLTEYDLEVLGKIQQRGIKYLQKTSDGKSFDKLGGVSKPNGPFGFSAYVSFMSDDLMEDLSKVSFLDKFDKVFSIEEYLGCLKLESNNIFYYGN